MISGHVNDSLELIIPVSVRGPTRVETIVELIVDTGFSSAITLPKQIIEDLQLNIYNRGMARLADGTIRQYQNYSAEILWNDQWRSVVVMGIGDEALLGTDLLSGHELQASFVNTGPVKIMPIKRSFDRSSIVLPNTDEE